VFDSDLRLGAQAQTVAKDFEKVRVYSGLGSSHYLCLMPNALWHQVFPINSKLMVGLTGLASDVLSLRNLLTFRTNLYKLQENREIKPETFSALLSTLLYEKRYGSTCALVDRCLY
jgi:20S proteasome subunit beta 3